MQMVAELPAAERSGVRAGALRDREVELVDHYRRTPRPAGHGAAGATAGYSEAVARAGDRAGRQARLGASGRSAGSGPAWRKMTRGRMAAVLGPVDRHRTGTGMTTRTRSTAARTGQPSNPLRDFQRSKVYDAEHLVHRIFDRSADYPIIELAGSHVTLPVERKFGTIDAVQRYVDQVLSLRWVRQRWSGRSPGTSGTSGPGARRTTYGRCDHRGAWATARVRPWALRELVMLHEVSHHLADTSDRRPRPRVRGPIPRPGRRRDRAGGGAAAAGHLRRERGAGRLTPARRAGAESVGVNRPGVGQTRGERCGTDGPTTTEMPTVHRWWCARAPTEVSSLRTATTRPPAARRAAARSRGNTPGAPAAPDPSVQLVDHSLNLGAPRSLAEIWEGSSCLIGSGHSIPRPSSTGLKPMPAIPGFHSSVKQ